MTAITVLFTIFSFTTGCYVAYLLYAELRLSNTLIGRRQREMRQPGTREFARTCMVIMFTCPVLLLFMAAAFGPII